MDPINSSPLSRFCAAALENVDRLLDTNGMTGHGNDLVHDGIVHLDLPVPARVRDDGDDKVLVGRVPGRAEHAAARHHAAEHEALDPELGLEQLHDALGLERRDAPGHPVEEVFRVGALVARQARDLQREVRVGLEGRLEGFLPAGYQLAGGHRFP